MLLNYIDFRNSKIQSEQNPVSKRPRSLILGFLLPLLHISLPEYLVKFYLNHRCWRNFTWIKFYLNNRDKKIALFVLKSPEVPMLSFFSYFNQCFFSHSICSHSLSTLGFPHGTFFSGKKEYFSLFFEFSRQDDFALSIFENFALFEP